MKKKNFKVVISGYKPYRVKREKGVLVIEGKEVIEEKAFEYLEEYAEGLRICRGKVKREIIEKYRVIKRK